LPIELLKVSQWVTQLDYTPVPLAVPLRRQSIVPPIGATFRCHL